MKKITLLLLFLFISISGYSQLVLEGFENTTGITGPLPATWSLGTGNWAVFERNTPSTVGTAQSWGVNTFPQALPYQGSNCASVSREQISLGNKSEDFLATPAVNIPVNGELHFFNRMFTSGDQGTIYQIRLAPATSSQTDPASYTILAKEWTEPDLIIPVTDYNVYTENKVDLSAWATGGPYYVAFVKVFTQPTNLIDGDRWLIDNVSIDVKCFTPVTAATTTPTANGSTLNWSNPSGANQWQLEIILSTATPTGVPNHTYNGLPPYVVTDLLPNTSYKYYVRGICSTGYTSDWSVVSATFTTGVAPPGCGGNYVDPGGPTGNYPNSYPVTATTVCPPTPGDAATITFTSFATSNNDILRIYDGDTTGATLLASLSGTTLPPSYTSSAANGCLTFTFTSNANNNNTGWISNITCAPPPTCRKPGIATPSATTSSSVTLTWAQGPNPDTTTATSWHVLALPCGSIAPTAGATGFVTANTNTGFVLNTGLSSATCYDIYIRAACSASDNSVWVGPVTVTTLVAPAICGGNYLDPGALANYPNSFNNTATPTIICPTNTGDVVTVTFTSFNTEASYDGLYVYDGTGVNAANLIASNNGAGNVPGGLAGSYWGTVIPGPFTSSSADGCLTFVFRSDTSTPAAGWISNITCGPPPACRKPTAYSIPSFTYNSATLNWTQPANPDTSVATAWQVLKLPCGSPAPTSTATGWVDVTSPSPYTLTGLTPQTCYDIYIRAVCGGTVTSAWAGPRSITTPIAPPVCGGTYVDLGGTGNYLASSNDVRTICPVNAGDQVTVTFSLFNTETNYDGMYVYDGNSVSPATLLATTNPASNVPGGLAGSYWGNLTGANLPGPFTASNSTGCLTFVFRSDGFSQNPGWLANVTCAPPPTCFKPITPTVASVTSTSALLGWTDTTSVNTIPAAQWEVLVLPLGSPLPLPSATGTIVSSNPALITGLQPATQYTFYVRAVCSSTDQSSWSTGKDFLTLIINDDCSGAVFVPVNSTSVCQQVASGTITGSTASTGPAIAPCIGTPNDDVWFQFVASNPYLNVSLQNIIGSTQNLNFAVYSGSCGTLTRIFCSATNEVNGVVNGMTVGNTYYIRIYSNSSAVQTVTFDLCVSTPSTCLTGSASVCSLSDYPNSTGIDSLGTIGCLTSAPNPAYFTIQVATSGPINFLLTQSSVLGGTPDLDVDYAAWGPFTSQSVACAAIAGGRAPGIGVPVTETTGCSFSPDSIENLNITNALAGEYYIVLITNYSGDPGFINLVQTNNPTNANPPPAGVGGTNCCPDAYFTYTPAAYCKAAGNSNPIAVITSGSLAGTFTSTPGLVFANANTGEIDLMASTAGNYVITNTTAPTTTCISYSKTYTISIVEPTSATISYGTDIPKFCQSVTALQTVTQTGTPGGSYSAIPNVGLSINPLNGDINPSLSSPGVYTVIYGLPGSVCTTGNPSAQVEILALPAITQPLNVAVCNSYTLPTLAVGNYFSQTGGVGPIDISAPLTSSQTVYIYAVGTNGCTNEKSFTVTINSVPPPTYTTSPSGCGASSGSINITGPIGNVAPIPSNLFISEVTDATQLSQTYIEIYNGTGAPVNLSNYKIRTFNNGSTTVTFGCDNILSGTLNNNSVYVVSVGAPNVPGVLFNQAFAGCSGVNQDDCIKLTTLTNTVIDVWGRTDGIPFTPLGQPGYDYRRLQSAVHPSTTFNSADWLITDWTATTEDYSDVNRYVYATSSYQYSIDNGVTFQVGTPTGINYSNLAPGDYTIIVKDMVTGCLSAPVVVTVGATGTTQPVTTFNFTSPICKNATPNPSASGFTPGGTFSEDTTISTGLVFLNTATGEIDLANSTVGSHTIKYTVPIDLVNCVAGGFSNVEIVINPIITPNTAFTYATPICQNAANPSATGFIAGGTFSEDTTISTGLVFLNTATGEIDLANSTTGSHTIKYEVAADPSTCQVSNSSPFTIVINPVITPNTAFTYTTPICQNATNPSASGFIAGGTFSEDTTISTGLVFLNTATGEIDLANSTAGSHTIKYEVAADPSICQVSNSSPFTIVINPVVTPNTAFTYTTPICQNATNPSATGFIAGGTFSEDTTISTGLVFLNTATGEIDLANSTTGSHTIKYEVAADPSTCQVSSSTPFTIVINPVITPNTAFTYTSPVCKNAANPSATGFIAGGTFSEDTTVSTGLVFLNTATGQIDLANSTVGSHTIIYTVAANPNTCQVSNSTPFTIVINPIVTLATGFSYDSPFCAATGSESPRPGLGFTTGGIYSSTPGLIINPSTGDIDLSSTPGTYTVTYTVTPNAGNCEVSTPGTAQVMIISPVAIALTGGCQTTKYILTANPVNGSFIPENATYVWENEQGVEVAYTRSIEVTIEGLYTVTVTVDGCSTKSLPFNVENASCTIQKGISVNNDGLNDTFDLSGFDVKKLTIFNRLGMKVYSRNNYVDEWGGKSDDGDELPDGTYFYVIDKNVGDTVTGWIYINRAQ